MSNTIDNSRAAVLITMALATACAPVRADTAAPETASGAVRTQPAAVAETTEPAEPAEPTEPTEPTEPNEPIEPTEPAQPTQPTETTEATDPEPEPKPEPAALVTVQDANASSSRSEVDGLELEELSCAVSRPLLGIIAVTGALGQRKKALDKCAKSGAAFVAHFEFEQGKTRNVTVEGGTAAQNRCMVKALSATKAPLDARCGAVILVGKSEGARTSLAALREATP